MSIIDSNNGRCPFCDSRAYIVVTLQDSTDATRDKELWTTLKCLNESCQSSFCWKQVIPHMAVCIAYQGEIRLRESNRV